MLQKSPLPPSTGALRLLRWLALYGSFGTAAGATAFVLEEQRRQICRLSRIKDNGKKLREFMHRRNHTRTSSSVATPAPSLPDFHDYVQDLETKGLVKREPIAQSGKAGVAGRGQDEYHYEMNARVLSTSKLRPNSDSTGRKHNVTPNGMNRGGRRTYSSSSKTMRRLPSFRRLESIPLAENCTRPLSVNVVQQSKSTPPTAEKWRRPSKRNRTRIAFEVLIADQNVHLDTGDLQEFLSTAARAENFDSIGRLLDACEAELPWSTHLYPSFLHSLVLAAMSLTPSSSNAKNIFLLAGRVFENSGIDATSRIESFYQAGAFPLVLAAYQHSPGHTWSPDIMAIILESALQMTALGVDCTLLLANILRRIPKNGHFFRIFPHLYEKIIIPVGSRGLFHLTVLQSLGQVCGQDDSPGMLDMLDIWLKRCLGVHVSPTAFCDVAINIIDGAESCCEQWYSRLLFCFQALPRNHDPALQERLLELGLQSNFLQTIEFFRQQHHVQQSPAVAQARLLLDNGGSTNFTAEDVQDIVFTFRNRKDLVAQLFRRCFHLELPKEILQRSWAATIQNSTEDEIIEFLDTIQLRSNAFSHLHLERVRAALLRQTWRLQHNFDRVQALFEHINQFRSVDSKKVEAGILSSTMIAICAKAGRWEEAKHYVWDARHLSPKSKSKLDQVGQYYETLLHARRGQWKLVKENFSVSREAKSMHKRDELFLEILGMFSQQHQPQEALDFCKWCIGVAGASPTQQMFDILISACLAEGNAPVIGRVLGFMRELQFQWQIRAETVAMSFRKYANKYKPKAAPFMDCMKGLQGHPKLLSKDVCLVLMERCSVAARRIRKVSRERLHLMQKRGQEKLVEQVTQLESLASNVPWISQQEETGLDGLENPLLERAQAYYIRMQVASSLHNWQEVVSIFQESLQQHIPRLELSLCLAVTACLRLMDGSTGFNLIQDAQKLGFTTAKAEVVLSQCWIADPANNAEDLRKKVFQHYAHLHRQYLPLDHGLLVQAAHALVLKSQPAASVALLTEVYQSSFAKIKAFDIVAMTSFLTAYSRVSDLDGVRWTIKTILVKDLLLDVHFFRALVQARYRFCRSLLHDGQMKRSQEVFRLFLIWDTICWRKYEKQQRHVIITGRVMTNTLVRLYMKDAATNRLNSRARVRKLYGLQASRANVRARLQSTRTAAAERKWINSPPLQLNDGISSLVKDEGWPQKEQQVEEAFSAIDGWKEREEQCVSVIPANEEVEDAVSKLLGFDPSSPRISRRNMNEHRMQEAFSDVEICKAL